MPMGVMAFCASLFCSTEGVRRQLKSPDTQSASEISNICQTLAQKNKLFRLRLPSLHGAVGHLDM